MTPSALSTSAPLRRRLEALLALQGRTEDSTALDAMMGGPCVLWANVAKVAGETHCEPQARERMRIRLAGVFRVPVHAFALPATMTACLMRAWEGALEWQRVEAVRILTESTQQPDTGGQPSAVE